MGVFFFPVAWVDWVYFLFYYNTSQRGSTERGMGQEGGGAGQVDMSLLLLYYCFLPRENFHLGEMASCPI